MGSFFGARAANDQAVAVHGLATALILIRTQWPVFRLGVASVLDPQKAVVLGDRSVGP